jgi:N-acetyltransferase
MSWINSETILEGEAVDLVPLKASHLGELKLVSREKRIWEYYVVDASTDAVFDEVYSDALSEKTKGSQFPFVIVNKKTGRLIGSTRYLDIQKNNLKLEIGWTWLSPECWGTEINFECKLLLLAHAFEIMECRRVQLKTDENNFRSRKAILKIGAQFEGILRNDMVRQNLTKRNSAIYSILDTEWPLVKEKLSHKLHLKRVGGI